MTLNDKIPRANTDFLENNMFGKFVQLYVDGEPYLRFSHTHARHSSILSEFIRECLVAGDPILDKGKVDPLTLPQTQLGRYHAVGMGNIYSLGEQLIVMYCASNEHDPDYQLGPNKEHLEAMAEHMPEWKLESMDEP